MQVDDDVDAMCLGPVQGLQEVGPRAGGVGCDGGREVRVGGREWDGPVAQWYPT